MFPLHGGRLTSDGVGLDYSLVVGDGPSGSGHDSVADRVGSVDIQVASIVISVDKKQSLHVVRYLKHLSINDYQAPLLILKNPHLLKHTKHKHKIYTKVRLFKLLSSR